MNFLPQPLRLESLGPTALGGVLTWAGPQCQWTPGLLLLTGSPANPRHLPRQGPGPHACPPSSVPKHAGCPSPLSAGASSRCPRGLGAQANLQAATPHQIASAVPISAFLRLLSLRQPAQAASTSSSCRPPRPPLPLSHLFPTLQPDRCFSEKTQVTALLRVPRGLNSTHPPGKSQTPPVAYRPSLQGLPLWPGSGPAHSRPPQKGSALWPPGLLASRPLNWRFPAPGSSSPGKSLLIPQVSAQKSAPAQPLDTTWALPLGSQDPRPLPVMALPTLHCQRL